MNERGGDFCFKKRYDVVNCLFTNHMGGQICMGGHLFFTGIGGGIYSIFCVQICFIDFYWPGIILL